MKKLKKEQIAERDQLAKELEVAQLAYLAALEKARDFAEGISDDQQAYSDDRSEKWQESDAGSNYYGWLDAWQEVKSNLDEAIEGISSDLWQEFRDLPTEPEKE